ncbi:MAG TPA: tetratricopeptide repeat protein [Candidatus Limnocylindrales bacterium]|nr:tetratricopeptide repeat protein [Candidatus Limnocylindrales bacterium]
MSINDGLALIRRHKFDEALPLLAAEVRLNPDDAYAAYYLAFAFVGAQDPQPAVALLANLVQAHPTFVDARNLLGLARLRTSDFPGAMKEYQAVLSRDPQNATALQGLGMIHYWRRETALAEDFLDRALRQDPGARDALVFKADLRFSAGDIGAAVVLLKDARRVAQPSLPEVSDLELNDRLVRYEAALEPLRRARSGLPAFPGWVLMVVGGTLALIVLAAAGLPGAVSGLSHYRAGKDLLSARDYAGCASQMEQAVGAVPDSSKAWAYQAYCYLLDGDKRAGLSAWATARYFEPHVTLDSAADTEGLFARIRAVTLPRGGPQ